MNWPMSFDDRDLTDQLDTLYRYALGATGDPDLAADVVQDTVVRAIERRDQYRSDAPLGHWLIRIAHNVAVDRFRRSSREITVEEVEHDWHDDAYTVDSQAVTEAAAVRHELLDALARLPANLRWNFVHIGGGDRLAALKAQAADLGLEDRVTWRGALAQADVLAAYRNADLFVLPSRIAADGDRDGLPNVLVEAQSQRVACISTAVSAIPEFIEDGVTGCLVPPDDIEALAEKITALARDPERRERLGAAGEQRVRDQFDADHGLAQLIALFPGQVQPRPATAARPRPDAAAAVEAAG